MMARIVKRKKETGRKYIRFHGECPQELAVAKQNKNAVFVVTQTFKKRINWKY